MFKHLELGWASRDGANIAHNWEYDQATFVLRSKCHLFYRRTKDIDGLHADEVTPHCKICMKRVACSMKHG